MLDKGTTVGGYRIDGTLGEGGMGVVYRATQLSLNRSVALKILSADFGDDPDFRERFRREGLLQAAIDHPHIVTVYDTGETEHGLFLAMSMVRGPTLKDMILSHELDPGRSLRLLSQVADALDTAHDVGLTHRDIKPQNILIGARDHAFLADFGLTKAPDEAGRLTATGQFVGTIDYVSPEQIQGEPATGQSDVYALTGVLCECLIGQVPFPKPTEAAVVYAHITEPPPKLTEHRPELPEAIDEVVARGMAKAPGDRPASAGELLREVERAFGDALQTAATPPGPLAAPEETGVRDDAPPTQPARTADPPRDVAGGVTATSPVQGPRAAPTAPAAAPTPPAAPPAAPDRPGAAPPATPERAERRPFPFLALAAGLGLVAAIAGFLIGGSGDESKPTELGSSASAGTLGLSFPDGWKRVAQAPDIPGMRFSQPIVLAPDVPGTRLVAGQVDAAGPTLLPRTFLARLPSAPARDDAVKLGALQAYRYKELTAKGTAGRVTVYAAPTSANVATVACVAPTATADDFAQDCERVAASLHVTGVKALKLGPSEAYAKSVGATFERLNTAVSAGAKRLSRARTPAAQAGAARTMAGVYRGAARRVSAAPAGPWERDAGAAVSASLRAVGAAYSRAAGAASGGDRGEYAAARRSIRSAGSALEAALRRLEALGYQVE